MVAEGDGGRVRPVLVGVAGGSGAGKSTVVRRLVQALSPREVAVVHHDAYYRDLSHLSPGERDAVNFDHPDAIDTPLLVQHLAQLLTGRSVAVPTYDFAGHVRRAGTVTVDWRPVVVLDGMFVLADARLRELLDLKIFVDTPDTERLHRRLRRDVLERGRSADSVMNQYRATVRPMHVEFIEPSKAHADIIIAGEQDHAAWIDLVVARVRRLQDEG